MISLCLSYATLGALAYGADRRWGVETRGWFVDLTLPEPTEHDEGFLVERPWRVHLFWSLVLAGGVAALGLALGGGPWYSEVPTALVGAVACLWGIRTSLILEMVVARWKARREARRVAARAASDASADAAELVTPAPAPEPVPTQAELEAGKIARMNELLGRAG
jgi:hypothetical protein